MGPQINDHKLHFKDWQLCSVLLPNFRTVFMSRNLMDLALALVTTLPGTYKPLAVHQGKRHLFIPLLYEVTPLFYLQILSILVELCGAVEGVIPHCIALLLQ